MDPPSRNFGKCERSTRGLWLTLHNFSNKLHKFYKVEGAGEGGGRRGDIFEPSLGEDHRAKSQIIALGHSKFFTKKFLNDSLFFQKFPTIFDFAGQTCQPPQTFPITLVFTHNFSTWKQNSRKKFLNNKKKGKFFLRS